MEIIGYPRNIILCNTRDSLRASSPIWASETSLARTLERAAKPRGRVLARLASLAQIGELARRLHTRVLGCRGPVAANLHFAFLCLKGRAK